MVGRGKFQLITYLSSLCPWVPRRCSNKTSQESLYIGLSLPLCPMSDQLPSVPLPWFVCMPHYFSPFRVHLNAEYDWIKPGELQPLCRSSMHSRKIILFFSLHKQCPLCSPLVLMVRPKMLTDLPVFTNLFKEDTARVFA